jgi:hypothetical protein
MQTLINIELGYIKCDIDGDGYNRLTVMRDDDVEGEACFSVNRETKCYGDQSFDNLTRSEALAWVEDQHFLVATRYARKQYELFVRELKAGKHDPAPTSPSLLPLLHRRSRIGQRRCGEPRLGIHSNTRVRFGRRGLPSSPAAPGSAAAT